MKEEFLYMLNITRWVDGDTVVGDVDLGFKVILEERVFRLLGINTPEKYPQWSKYAKYPANPTEDEKSERNKEIALAAAAKAFSEKYCPPGSTILIKVHKRATGKFGRYLIEIQMPDGKTLNQMLLDSGLAQPF